MENRRKERKRTWRISVVNFRCPELNVDELAIPAYSQPNFHVPCLGVRALPSLALTDWV